MKRVDLIKKLRQIAKAEGRTLELTDGRGPHTKAVIGERQSTIPRHREINELTARAIIADLSPDTDEQGK